MRHDRSVDLRQPGKVAHGFVGRSRQTLGIDGTIGRTRRGQISLEAAVDDRREWALEAAGRLPVGRSRLGGLLQMTFPSFFSLFGAQSGSAGGNKRRVLLVAAGRSGGSSWKLHAEQVVRQSPTLTNPLSALRQVWGLEAGRALAGAPPPGRTSCSRYEGASIWLWATSSAANEGGGRQALASGSKGRGFEKRFALSNLKLPRTDWRHRSVSKVQSHQVSSTHCSSAASEPLRTAPACTSTNGIFPERSACGPFSATAGAPSPSPDGAGAGSASH